MEQVHVDIMKKTVWDYLFFASLGVVALWLILKLVGAI